MHWYDVETHRWCDDCREIHAQMSDDMLTAHLAAMTELREEYDSCRSHMLSSESELEELKEDVEDQVRLKENLVEGIRAQRRQIEELQTHLALERRRLEDLRAALGLAPFPVVVDVGPLLVELP